MKPLTPKREAFAREYIKDLNATQAAIRAGYAPSAANREASRLLSNVDVQARISELMRDRNESLGIDAKAVLAELIEVLRLDLKDIVGADNTPLPVADWPAPWRRFIAGLETKTVMDGELPTLVTKFKFPDKVKVLELIGKHIGVNAFDDRTQDNNGKKLANVQKAWALYQAGAMTKEEYAMLFEDITADEA